MSVDKGFVARRDWQLGVKRSNVNFPQTFYRSLFTRLAPYYRIVNALSWGSTAHQRSLAVKYAAIKPGSVVADLMCGTGNNARLVLKAGAGQYIGIDAAAAMMAQGEAGISRISYVQADLTKLLAQPIRVDHVVCTYGIKCLDISSYSDFSKVVNQILKPGGTVSILEFRLPRSRVFRFFANLYVSVFCGLICLLLTGKWPPTRDLYRSMTPDIYPTVLADHLARYGFDITIQEKPFSSAVLIYGRKK